RRRPGTRHRDSRHLHLQARLQPDAVRLRRGRHRDLLHPAARNHFPGQPAFGRKCRRRGARLMRRRRTWPLHLVLIAGSAVMLLPFYWVLKTSISGENIFAYPPSIVPHGANPFYYVDVWYAIPFARYFANSVVVSAITIAANVVLNAMAGYALTQRFRGKK